MSAVLIVLLYVALVSALGYFMSWLMVPIFGRAWRLVVAPGIIVHELAHALACVMVGARVREINFWKVSGGHVIHETPRLHLIGPVVISFAPTIFMTIILVALAPIFAPQALDNTWFASPPESVIVGITGYVAALFAVIVQLPWLDLWPLLLVYAMLNVAVTIAPSKPDLLNARWALGAVLILVFGASQLFGLTFSVGLIWPALAVSLVYLGIATLGVGVVWFGAMLVRKTPRRKHLGV